MRNKRNNNQYAGHYPASLEEVFSFRRYKAIPEDKLQDLKPLTTDRKVLWPEVQEVQKYLDEQHISLETAANAGVCCLRRTVYNQGEAENQYYICYVNRIGGKTITVKLRDVHVKNMLTWTFENSCSVLENTETKVPLPPYNIDCINPDRNPDLRQLIVTEGEKDTLALMDAGFQNVISVPNGASADPKEWLKVFRPWLDKIGEIVMCGDEDNPGDLLKARMRYYLGNRRGAFRVIEFPEEVEGCKDIADVLKNFGPDKVREIIGSPKQYVNNVVDMGEKTDDVIDFLQGRYDRGFDLQYGPYTDRHMRFNCRGSLIIVTGMPGSGKSDFLHDILLHILSAQDRERRIGICSFEQPEKERIIGHFVQRMLGTCDTDSISPDEYRGQIKELERRIDIFDYRLYSPTIYDIMDDCDRQRDAGRPIDALVIDPYSYLDMEIKKYGTETEAIHQMLVSVAAWAHERKILVFIVAHPRKLATENGTDKIEEIRQYSISGSAQWANCSDYIFSVRRVKKEETEYTEVNMIKVRNQDLCSLGKMYFVRGSGRNYSERPSAEACLSAKVQISAPHSNFDAQDFLL